MHQMQHTPADHGYHIDAWEETMGSGGSATAMTTPCTDAGAAAWHDSDYSQVHSDGGSTQDATDESGSVDSLKPSPVSTPTHPRARRYRRELGGRGDDRSSTWLEHVSTPWAQNVPVKEITLSEELDAFAVLVGLTPEERTQRTMLRGRLQELARTCWPESTTKIFGSLMYELSLCTSNVDIVVEGACFAAAPATNMLMLMRNSGFIVRSFDYGESTRPDMAHAVVEIGNTVANILFIEEQMTDVRKPVQFIKHQLRLSPAARPCIAAFRWVLQQSFLINPAKGGLSSYAVTLLVLSFCASLGHDDPAHTDSGSLLKKVLRYYGWDFDYATTTATLAGPVPKMHEGKGLSISDPCSPENNVAASCTSPFAFRAMVQYCSLALAKWETQIDDHINWEEYRGKTPLSSIISHKDLWSRAEQIRREYASTE